MALVKFSPGVPAAKDLPAGSMVLSLSGTDRDELRSGVIAYAIAIFAAGAATGYWFARRSTRAKSRKR